jgi:HD-GYP domain-containing protein (c-di-GMP phosphodiesterase class II)/DNA-binding CsgD family transcriptional regulator
MPSIPLAQPVGALSRVSDLARGRPDGEALRAGLVGIGLAREAGLSPDEQRAAYWTTLLRFVGCSATSTEYARFAGGDDRAVRRSGDLIDSQRPAEAIAYLARLGGGGRTRHLLGLASRLPRARATFREGARADCEVGAHVARRIVPVPDVDRGLMEMAERWDGNGPLGLRGASVSIAARVATLAFAAVMFGDERGPAAARSMARRWAGRVVDPELAAIFVDRSEILLAASRVIDPLAAVVAAEPGPSVRAGDDALLEVAAVFGDTADLKAGFLAGHSRGVAALAGRAAERLGLPADEARAVVRAAHLQDIGRMAVATGTWERPGPLGPLAWDQVRTHPWHAERILASAPVFAVEARLAGRHHERLDGRGYHRGLPAAMLGRPERILAAADAWDAATSARPYRAALSPGEAMRVLGGAGLDAEALEAVAVAAGHALRSPSGSRPSGLSEREVEVLRMLVHGRSIREIAGDLVLSPSTVHTHVLHIYEKTGVTTRAGAAMYAMASGLVHPDVA